MCLCLVLCFLCSTLSSSGFGADYCSYRISRMWVVIKFTDSDEVEAVPSVWYDQEKQECFYPPFQRNALEKAIKQQLPLPDDAIAEGWKTYRAKLLSYKSYDNFVTANAKASRACITSDLSTAEESDIPKRRIIRKPQLYSPPNSSDSDDSNFGGLKDIPKMPNGANKPVQKNQSLRPQFKSIPDSRGTNTGCSEKSQSFQIEDCQTGAEENLSNAGTYDSTVTNVMVKQLIYIKKYVQSIDKKIDLLSEQLKQVSVSCEAQPSVDTEKWELLPLQNMEQFNAFEDKLKNETFFNDFVKMLSRLGGVNFKECIRRCLTKLISDDLAKLFTMHGFRDGKKPFIKTCIHQLIINTMKVTNESISIKDIEIQIGLWLTKSTERLKKNKNQNSDSVVN